MVETGSDRSQTVRRHGVSNPVCRIRILLASLIDLCYSEKYSGVDKQFYGSAWHYRRNFATKIGGDRFYRLVQDLRLEGAREGAATESDSGFLGRAQRAPTSDGVWEAV